MKENSNFYKNRILICLHTDVEASVVEDASLALVFSAFSTSLAIWAATCTKKIINFLRVSLSNTQLGYIAHWHHTSLLLCKLILHLYTILLKQYYL